jgi:hypothetical protein
MGQNKIFALRSNFANGIKPHTPTPNKCNIGEIQSESIKNRPNSYNGYGTREATATTTQRHDITIAESLVHFADGGCNKVKAAELFTFALC